MSAASLVEFVLDFLLDEVHPDVFSHITLYATDLRSKSDVEGWMRIVKSKLGRERFAYMKLAYESYCKRDCGFEILSPMQLRAATANYGTIM